MGDARVRALAALAVVASFFWLLGAAPLFDVDEGAFSQATLEMFERGDFLTTYLNGEPRYDKPILVYWLQAAAVALLGPSEWAFRLPSALCATLWAWLTYLFTRRHFDEERALLAAVVLATSLGVFIIGRAATADALLNMLVAASMFAAWLHLSTGERRWLYATHAAIGLGVLAKGPIAILVPFATTFLYCASRGELRRWARAVFDWRALLLLVAIALPWYVVILLKEGRGFVEGFFLKHNVGRFSGPVSGHAGSVLYYVPALLLINLPFTALLVPVAMRARHMDRCPAALSAALVRVRVRVLLALGHEAAALHALRLHRARGADGGARRRPALAGLGAAAGARLLPGAPRPALWTALCTRACERRVLPGNARRCARRVRHELFRLLRRAQRHRALRDARSHDTGYAQADRLRVRGGERSCDASGAGRGLCAAGGDQGSGAPLPRARPCCGDVAPECAELQRLSRRADAEPRSAAGRCRAHQGEPAPRVEAALRPALLEARRRARENRRVRHWRLWLLPAAAAVAFVLIWTLDANRAIFLALNRLGPASSDWLWANITVLGDTVVAFALFLPLWRRRPELLWAFVYLALLGTLWVHGLKQIVDVERPPAVLGDAVHVIGPAFRAHTFPSGHATTVFAAAGLLALGLASRTWGALALIAATAAALSRAVVGVHWPLDILAGV